MKNQIAFIRKALSITIVLAMMLSMSLMAFAANETVETTHAAAVQAARDATAAAKGTDTLSVLL